MDKKMVLYLLTEIQAHLRNSDMRPVYPKITWSAHYYSSLQVLHYVLKILQSNASCQAQSGLPEVHNQENYAWLQHWPCYRHWNTITQMKICIHCHWAQRTPGSLWSRVQEQGIQTKGGRPCTRGSLVPMSMCSNVFTPVTSNTVDTTPAVSSWSTHIQTAVLK